MKFRFAFLPSIILLFLSIAVLGQSRVLVPGNFEPPAKNEAGRFTIRPLNAHDVMSNHSKGPGGTDPHYGLPIPSLDMPMNGTPLQDDLLGLEYPQRRIPLPNSFSYPVADAETGKMIGCVYLNYSSDPDHDAKVTWWLRTCSAENSLYQTFSETVKAWVNEQWPFENPDFNGRAIALND
jgi:hypothetical protein